MGNSKTIAVLLTVYNRKDTTLRSLKNLFAQTLPEGYRIAVYLTNDGCTDGTPEAVATEFPQVNIIKGDGNLYWNRGMYKAWAEAEKENYDYYLWLNDDTFLMEDCIHNLLSESNISSDSAIIIGATTDSSQKKITYSGWRKGKKINPSDTNREAEYFNGNIVLIPREVYKVLGKNDYYYRHALGDFDYGLRATENGFVNVVCNQICGICDEHSSIPKWKDPNLSLKDRWKALYSVGGNGANPFEFFYFKRKHKGMISALTTFISNHVHVIIPKLWCD